MSNASCSVSRRGFIKAAGTAVAATGLLAAGAQAFADETGALVPGTYTGAADGISSSVTVTITVDESGAISELTVDSSGESADIGAAAQDELQSQLLAAGSPDIDGVAGATITSGAAKNAMRSALEQAATGEAQGTDAGTDGATSSDVPAWLGEKPVITDDDCVETVDCELLIVGSGTAGHFAAMSAVESGASPPHH